MKRHLKYLTVFGATVATALCLRADPVNEDEAYDPTDWFDGNNYEYDDTLGLDYTVPDSVLYEYWIFTPESQGQADKRNQNRSAENAQNQQNRSRYQNQNSSTPRERSQFGWHYEWDGQDNRYVRDYGWHDSYYDVTPNERSYNQPRQQRSQANRNQSSQRTIRGRVDDVQKLNLESRQGRSDDHSVIRLSLNDGRSVLVECGPQEQNKNVRFSHGDEIVVSGRTGNINGRRVLFAEQINLDGEKFRINRSSRNSSASERRNQPAEQNKDGRTKFSGLIEDFRSVWLSDRGKTNHVVEITLQDNQRILVDFGENSLSELNLSHDDPITVSGAKTQLAGRSVIRANEVWIDGDKKTFNNSREMRTSRRD